MSENDPTLHSLNVSRPQRLAPFELVLPGIVGMTVLVVVSALLWPIWPAAPTVAPPVLDLACEAQLYVSGPCHDYGPPELQQLATTIQDEMPQRQVARDAESGSWISNVPEWRQAQIETSWEAWLAWADELVNRSELQAWRWAALMRSSVASIFAMLAVLLLAVRFRRRRVRVEVWPHHVVIQGERYETASIVSARVVADHIVLRLEDGSEVQGPPMTGLGETAADLDDALELISLTAEQRTEALENRADATRALGAVRARQSERG